MTGGPATVTRAKDGHDGFFGGLADLALGHGAGGKLMMEASSAPRTVLVCGGRDHADRARVSAVLDGLHALHPIGTLVHGAATGADSLGAAWGLLHAEMVRAFPADWDRHGRAAGPIRNQQMLEEGQPDLVVAFPGGRGTVDMVRRAEAAGVPVLKVGP